MRSGFWFSTANPCEAEKYAMENVWKRTPNWTVRSTLNISNSFGVVCVHKSIMHN